MDKYYIWLLLALGEGEPEITRLLKQFGDPAKVYDAFVGNMALLGPELTERATKTKLETADKLLGDILASGCGVITIDSPEYPEHLKKQANPPCVLFTLGDRSLLQKKLVTVVGSRAVTEYTASVIPRVIEAISYEYAVVGTLSEGCDQLTCLNALRCGLKFIEVLPCGLNFTYPAGSKTLRRYLVENGGLVITEFLPKERSGHGNFLRRSRIIGGISYVTLVLQAGSKSGALCTAEYSLAPIFVPPNDVFTPAYSGAVEAVRNGAKLYMSPGDIDKAYKRGVLKEKDPNFDPSQKAAFRKKTNAAKDDAKQAEKPHKLPVSKEAADKVGDAEKAEAPKPGFASPDHSAVYGAIKGCAQSVGKEELLGITGLDAGRLSEVLLDLEIDGAIAASAGRYAAV